VSPHNSIISAGQALKAPPGLSLTNFHHPDIPTFKSRSRKGRQVNEIILHESVTNNTTSTAAVLQRRGLGVHLMIAPDGHVTQHADLAHDRLAHAKSHNGPSVGVEIINPYYPKRLRASLPWRRTIKDAPWAHKRAYILPTPEQAEATSKLIAWLTSPDALGLNIPRSWIGAQRKGHVALGRVKGAEERAPGVYAHHYFGHADAAWPALYAWLRLEAGLPPCLAYEEAIRRATGVRRFADVSDLSTHI